MSWRLLLGLLVLGLGASGLSGVAATNTVPATSMVEYQQVITPDDLKPAECASLTLTAVIAGSGTLTGTAANELMAGSSGADTISGQDGDDCILGGGGNDSLRGRAGNDVMLGQAGDDSLDGGPGTDVCYGGGDAGDTFAGCETTNP